MLEKLKLYFEITGTDKDSILELIIEQDTQLCLALSIDMSLLFMLCVEDYSAWLKAGSSSYTTSQSTDTSRYSEELRALIRDSRKARMF